MILRRRHLTARSRDARREIAQDDGVSGNTDGTGNRSITSCLAADMAEPSVGMERAELRNCLEAALRQVNPADRRVVSLRHFEQRSNEEVASTLGVRPAAARRRYYRALRRLRRVLPPALMGAA
jgi:RNA polymerase sigma-70 factor (ECF subfamily)